jgi:flavorubredoxin
VDEIADGIYRLSTFLPAVGPTGLVFNQFLIDADEPLLFHCGQRPLFAPVAGAARRVMDLGRLRWIAFSHVESDECGSLNDWLAAAPRATALHGRIGCNTWLNDMADRPPRVLADGDALDLGGKRVRFLETPHVPHGWDAALLCEETTGALFCSDLFTQFGAGPATTAGDIVAPAIAVEERLHFVPITAATAPTIRRLAGLAPRVLALMHGPSFQGDGAGALEGLAAHYDAQLRRATAR